jgi:hypothetical protein
MEQRQPRNIDDCTTIESIKEEMENLEPLVGKWFSAYIYYEEMYSAFEDKLNLLLNIEQAKQEDSPIEAD